MGILSKIFKPIKKVFKKIGKGIKSAFKKFGKFMNKLGPLGTIAMGMLLPGIGTMLGGAWSGMAGTLVGSSNAFLSGVGNFMTKAASFGSAVSGTVSNITGAVTDVLKETFRTVGKNIGLGNVGPKGMKAFFNATDGSLMGNNGLFKNVHDSFGKRWENMSARWSNFADHMKTSTAQYQGQLASGEYKPYVGYDQSKSMLANKELKEIKAIWTPELRAKLDAQREGFLSGVDIESAEGKALSDTWQNYEDRMIGLSPTEKKFASARESFLSGLDPNSDIGRAAAKQFDALQASKPGFFDLPKAEVTTNINTGVNVSPDGVAGASATKTVTPKATAFEKFKSSALNLDAGKLGERFQSSAISTGVSYLTAEEMAEQGGYFQPSLYYSQPIEPANNITTFLEATSPIPLNTEVYDWGTAVAGGGIYGTQNRGFKDFAPSPTAAVPKF
jgi:hypothetical protein